MLSRITNSQSPGGMSTSLVPCIGTPALLQAMCRVQKARSARASAPTTDCSKVTSIRTGMTRLLVPERRCAACSTASFWMSAMTTLAPASASAVAMPRPMPEAAPVTIAVLPEMSIICERLSRLIFPGSAGVPGPQLAASVEVAPGVDDDRLAGHRLGAAHRDHHVGAIILVGRLFQQRGRGRVLDLLRPEIGCRPRALQEAGRDTVDQRLARQ